MFCGSDEIPAMSLPCFVVETRFRLCPCLVRSSVELETYAFAVRRSPPLRLASGMGVICLVLL